MHAPAPISFVYHPWGENTFFYELDVRFGDRVETIGGSNVFTTPEIELMRAAMVLLAGRETAEARFPAENDEHLMTLVAAPHSGHPHWRASLLERPIELIWAEMDRGNVVESRSLGYAESLIGFAESALAFGESRVWPDVPPCAALIALRAAIGPLKAAQPAW
jgi:hypothetical protein